MSKMEKINLNEVSIVDHPAHMVEGFAVMKSASPDQNRALLSALRKETMPNEEKTLADVLKDATAEQIRGALTAEQLAELAPVAKAEETEDEIVMKSLPEPVRALIEKTQASLAAAEAREAAAIAKAAEAEETRANEAAVQKSKDEYTNLAFEHEVVAPALRKFAEASPEAAEAIQTMLAAVNKQADGAIFEEIGTTQVTKSVSEGDAVTKLRDIAKARAASEKISEDAAFIKAVADPANAELVTAYYAEEK